MELRALLVIEGRLDFEIDLCYITPGVLFNGLRFKMLHMLKVLVRMIYFHFLCWNFFLDNADKTIDLHSNK